MLSLLKHQGLETYLNLLNSNTFFQGLWYFDLCCYQYRCASVYSYMSFCAESFKNSAACHARRVPLCGGGFWGFLLWIPAPGLDAPL